MTKLYALFPFVIRQLTRRPARLALTALGVAVASFLLVAVEAMDRGVRDATEADARDTKLIVYRANRFCPFTSQLPQHYAARIEAIPGVASAIPIKIVVNNCRASLDVITYRGVPDEAFATRLMPTMRLRAGSLDEWTRRGDGAMVGATLAERRDLSVGDRFTAAGVAVFVAGIVESDAPQDRNVAYVHLPFLQETANRGGTGGIVTQFTVEVDDPKQLDAVAAAIDEEFARDAAPTSTKAEKAFVARAAADIVQVARFARWLGLAALIAVFALVTNAIALALQDRSREIAILQTLGFRPSLVTALVVTEGALIGLLGGCVGGLLAWAALRYGRFTMATEGVNVEIAAGFVVALAGIGWATGIGAVASVVPALKAALRPIVSSLRSA
ncbi:MAG: ABC transporter permease [Phycisphaerae bacterium]|nr:ABC transporter permease [Phycisphaerae bacterium]